MRKAVFMALLVFVLAPGAGNAAVVVDGKEWRDLTETTSLSFSMMVSRCNFGTGACQGSLLTPTRTASLDGWTWASSTEVAQLFDAIIESTMPSSIARSARDSNPHITVSGCTGSHLCRFPLPPGFSFPVQVDWFS